MGIQTDANANGNSRIGLFGRFLAWGIAVVAGSEILMSCGFEIRMTMTIIPG